MNYNRSPIITVGQVFLNETLNEYLIVTKNNRGQVFYEGHGFRGQCEDFDFLEKFPAVDPADVDQSDLDTLLSFVPPGTVPTVGFVSE